MATYLEELAKGVFLYVWEGQVTLDDIRASMLPSFRSARRVVFDVSGVDIHPFKLAMNGVIGHRRLDLLEHVYVVYRPMFKSQAEFLVQSTLKVPYSMHLSRAEALKLALEENAREKTP